jgi:hypothetical protein
MGEFQGLKQRACPVVKQHVGHVKPLFTSLAAAGRISMRTEGLGHIKRP